LIQLINADYADLILVEGFKNANIPKIEVYRPSMGAPMLCLNDKNIIAVASDSVPTTQPETVLLNLNNIQQITNFILQAIIKK
jgi:molybdopterin-guanine dinucleotide biosynthesis protein MobB